MIDKPKPMSAGSKRVTGISAKEHKEIDKRIKKRQERLRKRYPEVRGKVVDFISHYVTDGTLYFNVRFKDKTNFSLRYSSQMFIVGADFSDMKSGNVDIIREYMRAIPR